MLVNYVVNKCHFETAHLIVIVARLFKIDFIPPKLSPSEVKMRDLKKKKKKI